MWALLVNFDPIFAAAVKKLNNEATTETTSETLQVFINEFLEAFGPYYVLSVIVGFEANVYTYSNEVFHKEHDYSKVEEQVSLTFFYEKFKLSGDDQWKDIYNRMMEDYKPNFIVNSVFHPPVKSEPGQLDWIVWQNKFINEQPVVINRTIAPIRNLLMKYPIVRQHVYETTEFYLTNGYYPTLKQLRQLKRSVQMVPGTDIVGCGFDIGARESKLCLFDVENSGTTTTWTHPFDLTITYLIPTHYFIEGTPEADDIHETIFYNSEQEIYYEKRYVIDNDSDGFLGFGGKHEHKEINHIYKQIYQHRMNLGLTERVINWYKLSISTFPPPSKFNSITQVVFDYLSNLTEFDKTNPIWKQ
ncbi:unnamed protein product [Didymodactylos carnosus]|uniref:MACPF domain-containing protein n=1 Tax=Didymodactylos carnosus TaxID=1234261 RepID=A0A815G361_9BILA|nr:unnamed protein product [Didymodactylos carnosus]CAF4189512.1 unnamed protein product [Didymodactylos carnosus]